MSVHFIVKGEPQGKGRPRFQRAGAGVHTYTPDKTTEYMSVVRHEFVEKYKETYGRDTFPPYPTDDQEVEIEIRAYFAIPKSASKANKALMREESILPTKKPDADNILKVVMDALNGTAYVDDKQVVSATVLKYYSDEPYIEVTVWYYTDELRP